MKDPGNQVTSDFRRTYRCFVAVKKVRGELFRLRSELSCRNAEIFVPLYKTSVRLHLDYYVQAWSPFFQKDMDCLEEVQRPAAHMKVRDRGPVNED